MKSPRARQLPINRTAHSACRPRPLALILCSTLSLPLLSLHAGPALAADQATATEAAAGTGKPALLETVVVTASSVAQTLKDAPASISVITREDIEKRPVQELADLLGTIEGVSLSRSGNQVGGVQIRGLGQAYTLFLIDGKRVNSTNVSFRGNDYDTGWVPATEIERIEVVRGPMSSLYGSDAIGGVVNIITRKIGKTWRGSVKLDATFQQDREAGDTRSLSVSASGPLIADVLGLRVTSSFDRRDGDQAVNAPVNGTTQAGMPLVSNRVLGATLNWTPFAGHDVALDHHESRRDHGGFVLEREATSLSHHGRYDFGLSELTLNIDETRNLVGTVTGQTNPNKANNASLDGKLVLPWEAARQSVTIGGEVRHEKLRDPANITGLPGTTTYRADPEVAISQYAVFLEDEFAVTDALKLTVGDRYDHHPNFGSHNSPRAYLVYHATPEITFKGGVARAFRAPTLLQGSRNWGSVSCGSATVGCYIVGSANLKPETSTSKEIGAQFDYGALGGGVTLFHNNLNDMIDIDSRTADRALAPTYANFVGFLPDGRPIFSYQNIAKVRTQGVETSLRATFSPQWALRANYTYTDAKNTSGAKELPLLYRPKHTANLTLDWTPTQAWSASATLRLIGSQYLSVPASGLNMIKKGAYAITDLSGAYRYNDNLTFSAGLLNLANRADQRNLSSDFNEEGRRLFVSALARF